MSVKPWFEEEVATTAASLRQVREEGDLCFALVTDTLLHDTGADTRENIRAVDDKVGFDFFAHLGNFVNGRNPEKVTRKLFRQELEEFRHTVASGRFFPAQGDLDGYRDENFKGQLATSIARDEHWVADTAFLSEEKDLHRPEGAPYYYVDFPEQKARLVVLCSYRYEFDGENLLYEKRVSYGLAQIAWMQNEALQVKKGWHVLFLSHALPESRFECGKDPFIYNGYSTEKVLSIVQAAVRERGVEVAGFLAGRYHYDAQALVGGIWHVTVDQQFPQVSPAPAVEGAMTAESRAKGTREQDLWTACLWKPTQRKLYLFRFGAGEDRVISY